ncbi:PQQ-dependent sugar dehydrogenase [Dyadobacter tibetensis]|uniref:PQQ-dependent sugar dehydrogenase n=1 Tax=Dyadobacter tibetensis TaxID=1211851 RepID=UPI0004721426|nr:PQQ-dependent sugar dehydrogenase [Dyadobacter tibetensis]
MNATFLFWMSLIMPLFTLFQTSGRTAETQLSPPEFHNSGGNSSPPDSTRFTPIRLASGLDEPMGMAILPNLDVIVVERKGAIKRYNADTKAMSTIATLNVFSGIEDGLLGVAADPNFVENQWIYLYYGVGGDKNVSHLARYELQGDQLNIASKKVLLEVPTQRTYCCHSAGYLTFDADGMLYLSIGDNTNAEEIEGHNPTDERPGRELSDGQATSANSMDLRGKILRIKPLPNGKYDIPDGNLFPRDGSQGRPEIYVMGCRNPFRISVDPKTKFVYWGDVGPDTAIPAEEGLLSYDEINQARKPGFFGYPYFLGNNEGFPKYDFATKKEGPKQDPLKPINQSPNNSGIRELPPAQPAMIWYGKGPSKRWPLLGKGGASAMAGPVFYQDLFKEAPYQFPAYYHGKLIIYDWVRKWMMAVTLDANGDYLAMEPFLPHLHIVAPMDLQFGPDGALYLLAYGTNWFAKNTDAGLVRVEYSEGNRKPISEITINHTAGAVPLKIQLSAGKSRDYDPEDRLTYQWNIDGKTYDKKEFTYTLTKPGIYDLLLTVTDNHGGQSSASQQIAAGNAPPLVNINVKGNRSFYWDGATLNYSIEISDEEDRLINPSRTKASFHMIPFGKDLASALSGASHGNLRYAETQRLYQSLDCKACHSLDSKSIGPSLIAIATRYQSDPDASDNLSRKIISGGSGNWGTYPMPPHAELTAKEARNLSGYILSLKEVPAQLPLQGSIPLLEHTDAGPEASYVLQASYTDGGAQAVPALTSSTVLVLKNPKLQAEDFEEGNVSVSIGTLNNGYITSIPCGNGRFISFKDLDLTQVGHIIARIQNQGAGGKLVLRADSLQGLKIGEATIPAGSWKNIKDGWFDLAIPLNSLQRVTNLYLSFEGEVPPQKTLFYLDWIRFEKER